MVLSIERFVPHDHQTAFPNGKNIFPEIRDFEIINYVLMSSETGERWATITLKNLSSGGRILKKTTCLPFLPMAKENILLMLNKTSAQKKLYR